MTDERIQTYNRTALAELFPIAEQAARIVQHVAAWPEAISYSDTEFAARVRLVSAQQVATVRRVLIQLSLVVQSGFSFELKASTAALERLSANLEGIAEYQQSHRDRNVVRLVLTEPGEKSALREEIDRRHTLPPLVFQTTDAFISLARMAERELVVLAPFIDDQGADFLVMLFSLCAPPIRRQLICRPLSEDHCGLAFHKRSADFLRLGVEVYEYALPSSLPSGRETFHAKIILADDKGCYIGSSNLMGSALERSLECGVIITGEIARQLSGVVESLRAVSRPVAIVP
jgi:hypothetical protein